VDLPQQFDRVLRQGQGEDPAGAAELVRPAARSRAHRPSLWEKLLIKEKSGLCIIQHQ
jgi:hypothetical protein